MVFFLFVFSIAGLYTGCAGALAPEQTPQRVVINFLKEAGRGDYTAAAEWVAGESAGEVENWCRYLIFPEHGTPPSHDEESKIDRFIELFYRTNVLEENEATVEVSLNFFPNDALIGFPSVADDPTVPTSAQFTVILRKMEKDPGDSSQSTDAQWEIISLEP